MFTVSVTVPFAPETTDELKLQVGDVDVAGAIEQLRFTVELKLPTGATVTLEVAELPAMIVDGDSCVGVRVKDALPDPAPTLKLAPIE